MGRSMAQCRIAWTYAAGWHALSVAKGVVCSGRARLILNFASPAGNLAVVAFSAEKPYGMDLSDLLAKKLDRNRFPKKERQG